MRFTSGNSNLYLGLYEFIHLARYTSFNFTNFNLLNVAICNPIYFWVFANAFLLVDTLHFIYNSFNLLNAAMFVQIYNWVFTNAFILVDTPHFIYNSFNLLNAAMYIPYFTAIFRHDFLHIIKNITYFSTVLFFVIRLSALWSLYLWLVYCLFTKFWRLIYKI